MGGASVPPFFYIEIYVIMKRADARAGHQASLGDML